MAVSPKRLKYLRKWRAKNRKKLRTYFRKYRRKNGKHMSLLDRKWYQRNRNRKKGNGKRWRKKNLKRARITDRARRSRYRARKIGIPGDFTHDDILNLYYMQDGKCAYCGKRRRLTIDHIIPISRRGSSNRPSNLALACGPCNDSKCDMLLSEWAETSYYKSHCILNPERRLAAWRI